MQYWIRVEIDEQLLLWVKLSPGGLLRRIASGFLSLVGVAGSHLAHKLELVLESLLDRVLLLRSWAACLSRVGQGIRTEQLLLVCEIVSLVLKDASLGALAELYLVPRVSYSLTLKLGRLTHQINKFLVFRDNYQFIVELGLARVVEGKGCCWGWTQVRVFRLHLVMIRILVISQVLDY
jgi:hypothetical protein